MGIKVIIEKKNLKHNNSLKLLNLSMLSKALQVLSTLQQNVMQYGSYVSSLLFNYNLVAKET